MAVAKYHDVERLTGLAEDCLTYSMALALQIREANQGQPNPVRGRAYLFRLRNALHGWRHHPNGFVRAVLDSPGSAHRDVISRAEEIVAAFHSLAAAEATPENDNRARVYREIPNRWPEICAAMPDGVQVIADVNFGHVKSSLHLEQNEVLAEAVAEMVATARRRFNQPGELTQEKIRDVCLLAEEAAAVAGKYGLDQEAAIELLNDVAAAY